MFDHPSRVLYVAMEGSKRLKSTGEQTAQPRENVVIQMSKFLRALEGAIGAGAVPDSEIRETEAKENGGAVK
jgi:hypothetical protein